MESKSLIRNVALVGMASTVESALGLMAGVVIARSLGPAEYGHYAFSIWLCGLMLILVNHGLPLTATRFIAQARGSSGNVLAGAVLARLGRIQWIGMAVVLTLFVIEDLIIPVEDWKDAAWTMLAISLVAIGSRADFRMQGAIGKGYERFAPENLVLIIVAPINIALVLALALWGGGTVHYFLLFAIMGVVSAFMARFMLRREGIRSAPGPIPAEFDERLRRNLLLNGLLVMMFAFANKTVEMTLLKHYTDTTTVAYFAIAASLTKGAVDLLAGGMSAVLLPSMAKKFGQGGMEAMGRMVSESSRLYWMIGLVIAGFGVAITDPAIHLLYGNKYEGAIPALTCMLVVAGLLVMNGATSAALNAGDKQKERIYVSSVALALNLVLGWLLIPRLGLLGALISFSCTQLFEATVSAWRVRQHTKVSLPLGAMTRATVGAAAAAFLARWVALQLPPAAGLAAGIVIFLIVYTSLTVLLRTWRAAEFEAIANLFTNRGRMGQRIADRIHSLKSRYNLSDLVS
jgi:O-antigen/teichoic acid export membrane protein